MSPPKGWIKVNIDASQGDDKVTLAFTVRDHNGKLLLLSIMTTTCMSPFFARVKVLK